MTAHTVWRLNQEQDLSWWRCDNEAIVFHNASGDTHHLNELSLIILDFLDNTQLTTSELREKVASILNSEEDFEIIQAVDMALKHIKGLDLIESVG